jgi:hypothetical protein
MKKMIVGALLALSATAFAQPPAGANQDPAAWQQRMEQHRAQRATKLAEKLGLDASAAQRFQSIFDDMASKRKALFGQVKSANQTLRAAANGDQAAGAKVNDAVQQLRSVRAQMTQLQDELFDKLSNGLNDQQRAKLALMIERQGMHKRFGHKGHHGRGMMRGGPDQAPQTP